MKRIPVGSKARPRLPIYLYIAIARILLRLKATRSLTARLDSRLASNSSSSAC